MEKQLGAELMQFTFGLEGCCLIGPWGVSRGLQTWLGLWPNLIQSPHLLCLIRGPPQGCLLSPDPLFLAWALYKSNHSALGH